MLLRGANEGMKIPLTLTLSRMERGFTG